MSEQTRTAHDPTTCRDGDHYGQCSGVTPRYLDPAYRAQLVYDPRTGIHVRPHHRHVSGQCGATDRGYFCTVKADHDGWHAAYAGMAPTETLHIWSGD